MEQSNKQLEQFKNAKAGIELLTINVANATTHSELISVLNVFNKYILKIANERNNRPNKDLTAVIEYLKTESGKKREVKTITVKNKAKRLSHKTSYKDHIEDYIILKNRGHSYREIAAYSEKYFKVKVSKTTIGKILKEVN